MRITPQRIRVKSGQSLRVSHSVTPVKTVRAGSEPYHVVQGWRFENQTYKGNFAVDRQRYPGELWQHYGKICGRIAMLPAAVRFGPHSACFSADHQRPGRWRIHFADMPETIDGAILAVEQSIRESL